ncbi:neural cell adhesion molecule 2-like [Babylonia areolata]|uniref:neural cell adhesion molecule 2-like n=1 Tax=Babylonia areolata TaxID=304850 RepID=UPI003FD6386C
MKKVCSVFLCLLSFVCSGGGGVKGEQAAPVLNRPGQKAALQWKLPPSNAAIITIALQTPTLPAVFYYYRRRRSIVIDDLYQGRVDVLDSLDVGDGLVSFTLKNVTMADAGRYVCIDGFGDRPMDNCGQMLVVVGKPKDVEVVASSPPVEGEDLVLECSATSTSLPSDHGQPLQVQWLDSAGGLLSSGAQEKESVQGAVLTVHSVQRGDLHLQYSCRASDGLEVWSDTSDPYDLVPEYGPKESDLTMERQGAEVNQGGSVEQQCSATCNPKCNVTWEKLQIQGHWYRMDSVDGLLSLTFVQRDMAGDFHCKAENVHGSASLKFHLVVHYTPNLQQLTTNGQGGKKANLKEDTQVTLTCQFDSSPAPVVQWFRADRDDDLVLLEDDLQDQRPQVTTKGLQRSLYTSTYQLGSVTCSDTGVYQCAGRNQLGSGGGGQVDLHVVCMPRNTYGEDRLKEVYLLPASQSVVIRFQVEGYPQPDIEYIVSEDEQGLRRLEVRDTWILSSSVTSSQPYLTNFELRLNKPTRTYFDHTFYLEIENSEGTRTLAFMLREKGVPKTPRNLTAVWTEDTWVRLHWLPGFHGGKPQKFLVQYRDAEQSEDRAWVTVASQLEVSRLEEETEEESVQEAVVDGLRPGHAYVLRVIAHNQYGNSSSALLHLTTMATAAASTDGGAIAGGVVAVIIILVIIILVLVFFFIIRPRRRKQESKEDISREPMLSNGDKSTATACRIEVEEDPKPEERSWNTNTVHGSADRDTSTEPLITSQTSSELSSDERPRNQDGLIYADLDLAKPKDSAPKPVRKDAVNYQNVDLTVQAPTPPPSPTDQVPPAASSPADQVPPAASSPADQVPPTASSPADQVPPTASSPPNTDNVESTVEEPQPQK